MKPDFKVHTLEYMTRLLPAEHFSHFFQSDDKPPQQTTRNFIA